ncbi:1138_t:CDS:2 [Paraglomus occultum]|uniref:1138_t:CDS:1 n=1 Tax=Paraglomus occultum TaxID=144539 RepID=A0A9N9FXT5_9GLOM|nr:1138_t:CDS:2 [Paraglomus occultum]
MTEKVYSTKLFVIEPADVTLGSRKFYCQTIWYKPKILTDTENLLPADVICEVKLTDCTDYWGAKVTNSQLMENTTLNISKDFNNKRLGVIQGLLNGQRQVDNRPCRLSVNSQNELVFTVEGRENSSNYDEQLVAVVDIWKLQLHSVRDQSLQNMWRELLSNAIEQINSAEKLNTETAKMLKGKRKFSTKEIDRMNVTKSILDKNLIIKFSVVLNSKKQKIRKLKRLLERQE